MSTRKRKHNKSQRSRLELEKVRRTHNLKGTKQCSKCEEIKDKSCFSIEYKNTLSSWCKKCHQEFSIEYRKRDGEKERHRLYKSKYRKRKRREAKEKSNSTL